MRVENVCLIGILYLHSTVTTAGESVGNLHIIELAVLVSLLLTFLVPAVVCVSQFCGRLLAQKTWSVRGPRKKQGPSCVGDCKMIGWCIRLRLEDLFLLKIISACSWPKKCPSRLESRGFTSFFSVKCVKPFVFFKCATSTSWFSYDENPDPGAKFFGFHTFVK